MIQETRLIQEKHPQSIRLRLPTKRRVEGQAIGTPFPISIISLNTNEENRAKAGDFIRINGINLKFDPDDEHTGVFFVDYGETRADWYVHVSQDSVITRVPLGLSPGPYLIRLRTKVQDMEHHSRNAQGIFYIT